jgi:hypothetical protein
LPESPVLKRGDLLVPSIYMQVNGTNITGLVLDVKGDRARVFLNNGKDCWYDTKTITDLFDTAKFRK